MSFTYSLLSNAEKGEATFCNTIQIAKEICQNFSKETIHKKLRRANALLKIFQENTVNIKDLLYGNKGMVQKIAEMTKVNETHIMELSKIMRIFYECVNINFIYEKLDCNSFRMNQLWTKFYHLGEFNFEQIVQFVSTKNEDSLEIQDMLIIFEEIQKMIL